MLTLMQTSAFISTRLRLLLAGGIAVSSASAPCGMQTAICSCC